MFHPFPGLGILKNRLSILYCHQLVVGLKLHPVFLQVTQKVLQILEVDPGANLLQHLKDPDLIFPFRQVMGRLQPRQPGAHHGHLFPCYLYLPLQDLFCEEDPFPLNTRNCLGHHRIGTLGNKDCIGLQGLQFLQAGSGVELHLNIFPLKLRDKIIDQPVELLLFGRLVGQVQLAPHFPSPFKDNGLELSPGQNPGRFQARRPGADYGYNPAPAILREVAQLSLPAAQYVDGTLGMVPRYIGGHEGFHAGEAGDALPYFPHPAFLGLVGPVGVSKEGPGRTDKIPPAFPDQLIGKFRLPYHRHPYYRYVNSPFHPFRQVYLPALLVGRRLPGDVHGLIDAAAYIDGICPQLLNPLGNSHPVLQLQAFSRQARPLQEFIHRQPDQEGKVSAAPFPDAEEDLFQKAHPLLKASPVLVGPPVGIGAQKLVDQVTVGPVDFHPVKAGLLHPHRRVDELFHHFFHFLRRQGIDRLLDHLAGYLAGGGHGQVLVYGADALPARVINLGHNLGPMFVHRIGQGLEARNKAVIVHAHLLGIALAPFIDNDTLGDNEPYAPLGPGGVKVDIPLRNRAIGIGQGVPHGRENKPVPGLHSAYPSGRKQVGKHSRPPLL